MCCPHDWCPETTLGCQDFCHPLILSDAEKAVLRERSPKQLTYRMRSQASAASASTTGFLKRILRMRLHCEGGISSSAATASALCLHEPGSPTTSHSPICFFLSGVLDSLSKPCGASKNEIKAPESSNGDTLSDHYDAKFSASRSGQHNPFQPEALNSLNQRALNP